MRQALLTGQTLLSETEEYYKSTLIRYKLFTGVWAIATLFHMANFRMFTTEFHYFLLTLAACFLLLKPASVIRLLIFMCLQLYEVYNALPVVSNHWIFAAFVNLTIIHALLYQVISRRSFKVDRALFLESFAPLIRIELIILYFFVVFHKLNSGFFSVEVSCASNFYIAQNAYSLLPSTPEILALNAYGTIVIEALIPLLLCFRITRNWGLLIGLIFHCIIAYNPLNGFYDFSSLVFAVYFLFTSYSFSSKLYSMYKRITNSRGVIKNLIPAYSPAKLLMLIGVFFAGLLFVHALTNGFEDYFRHVLWTAFSFTFIGIFLLAMFSRHHHNTKEDVAFSVPHYSLLLIPLLVFLNGTTPYLGLKTEASFAMFSNLRTEGGISNHYLIPASSQIFDYQKELIEVVSSSDKVLNGYAESNQLMVYYHLQRLVALRKPKSLTYIRNGKEQQFLLSEASAGHELLQQQPFWFRKLVRFRTIHKQEPQPCAH